MMLRGGRATNQLEPDEGPATLCTYVPPLRWARFHVCTSSQTNDRSVWLRNKTTCAHAYNIWKWAGQCLVSCPHPFRINREGVWQHCHTTVYPARSVQCAPIRLRSSVTDLCTRWWCAVWQSSDHDWCCWKKEWGLKSFCWSKRR